VRDSLSPNKNNVSTAQSKQIYLHNQGSFCREAEAMSYRTVCPRGSLTTWHVTLQSVVTRGQVTKGTVKPMYKSEHSPWSPISVIN
jgi:hypothetical protein